MSDLKGRRPVIIISVFRSGSNLVKDIISSIPGYCTWPAENINFIWRHGNVLSAHDELGANDANESAKKFIHKEFDKMLTRYGCKNAVDKSEVNALRIGYVNQIFPNARYVFVMRDGRDAIASMLTRRHQALSLFFLLKKVRYVPLVDIPIVTIKYFLNLFYRFFLVKSKVYKLGPVFKGMNDLLRNHSEEEVVALQWAKCIEKAYDEISLVDSDRVYILKYENLVNNVATEVANLVNFIEDEISEKELIGIFNNINNSRIGRETSSNDVKDLKGITNQSVGKWKTQFDDKTLDVIMPIIQNAMKKIGYLD